MALSLICLSDSAKKAVITCAIHSPQNALLSCQIRSAVVSECHSVFYLSTSHRITSQSQCHPCYVPGRRRMYRLHHASGGICLCLCGWIFIIQDDRREGLGDDTNENKLLLIVKRMVSARCWTQRRRISIAYGVHGSCLPCPSLS